LSSGTSIGIRIGDLSVVLRAAPDSPPLRIDGAARRFPAAGSSPDLVLEVRLAELEAAPRGELLFDSGEVWRLYRDGPTLVFRFFSAALGDIPYKEARVDASLTRGAILLHRPFFAPDEPIDPLEFPLDELLFLHLFALRGGIELHACGVATAEGHGLLFAGQSGDGKTTTARLWEAVPGAVILSDDRIVIRRTPDGLRMFGTPWHGESELASNLDAPLSAVFLLGRGARNEVAALSPGEAAAGLFARAFVPLYRSDFVERGLALLQEVVSSALCYSFGFVPDDGAPEFVRRLVESA
jgi:hypothetical protein